MLAFFLSEMQRDIAKDVHNYEALEKNVNQLILSNRKIITNILKDADDETMAIVRDSISAVVQQALKQKMQNIVRANRTILMSFIVGGLVNLLTWIVENDFPSEIKLINTYLYKMLEAITILDGGEGLSGRADKKEEGVQHCPGSKEEAIMALDISGGLQYLLNEIHTILGNPLLIHDMEYNLVAYSQGAVTDDPIWEEFMLRGRLSDSALDFINNEGFIDTVAASINQDGITYLVSEHLKYDRIFGQLYNESHIPVADLVVVACENDFEDDMPELMKTACNVLSAVLGENEYYQQYGQTYQEDIIKKLVEGEIKNKGLYADHLANLDRGLKVNLFVAVADFSKSNLDCKDIAGFRDCLTRTQPAFKYFIYNNYVIILMSSEHTELRDVTELRQLAGLFALENIDAGVSSRFENLFELQKYYHEAVCALDLGRRSEQAMQISLYDDIKVIFNL